jgi:hypothetical protein
MNNTKALLIGIGVFLLIALAVSLSWGKLAKMITIRFDEPTPTPKIVFDDNDVFNLESTYQGDNKWSYTVTAQLPNPCHGATIESRVAESYPEQVTILVTPTFPKPDQYCIEMIEDFSYTGTFTASEGAQISLKVTDTR